MWQKYISANCIDEVLDLLAKHGEKSRIIAGATDLMLEIERGQHKEIEVLIDISRISGLDQICLEDDNQIHLGPLVTHNHCAYSKLIREYAWPLRQAAWQVGSPQIRNRGTIAGNLITASPANDTISPLMAMGATLTLRSASGERKVPLVEFYSGVRKTVMKPEEMLVDISLTGLDKNYRGVFLKLGLRKAQAISLVNICILMEIQKETVKSVKISLGSVAPTIIFAKEAENYLNGKILDEDVIEKASLLVGQAAKPISDIRSSSDYRSYISKIIASRALSSIKNEEDRAFVPDDPVVLWGKNCTNRKPIDKTIIHDSVMPIKTTINGTEYEFKTGFNKSLVHLLREEGLLTGTKEGCGEGECGACTIYLDGKAVMGCLVPAPRAHGAEITTIEGLSPEGELSVVQKAFIEEGAVQCGYCTPGFIMSATKLLEEKPNPTKEEIKQAITGNLCRCTGYYKIISAIEKAAQTGK